MGISYKYEHPLRLENGYLIYPDFTLFSKKRRKEIILEHLGMMDNPVYSEKAIRKINTYTKAGYITGEDIIYTFETSGVPIDMKALVMILKTV